MSTGKFSSPWTLFKRSSGKHQQFESIFHVFHLLLPYFYCSHVMLPKDLARLVPKSHLMTESEWRAIGVQQSRGNLCT